jgi:hypothetical protein
MKVKSKKDQLQDTIAEIERLLNWQQRKVAKAQKRYNIKSDWGAAAFWIGSDTSTLDFVLNQEQSIWNELRDYSDELSRQLINCD